MQVPSNMTIGSGSGELTHIRPPNNRTREQQEPTRVRKHEEGKKRVVSARRSKARSPDGLCPVQFVSLVLVQ